MAKWKWVVPVLLWGLAVLSVIECVKGYNRLNELKAEYREMVIDNARILKCNVIDVHKNYDVTYTYTDSFPPDTLIIRGKL